MEYQDFYIILCCIIIYSCIKISVGGFVLLLSLTFLFMLFDEQSVIISRNNDAVTSAKISQEELEKKVTKNPRKEVKRQQIVEQDKPTETENVVSVDKRQNEVKPSPFQHSYEQRKRLLESVYRDLETNNKWKTQDDTCKSIRSQSNFKL